MMAIVTITKHLLCTLHSCKHFTWMNSFNVYSNPNEKEMSIITILCLTWKYVPATRLLQLLCMAGTPEVYLLPRTRTGLRMYGRSLALDAS